MPSRAERVLRTTYSRHEWHPVSAEITNGAADLLRLTGPSELYVKIAGQSDRPDPGISPLAEAERLEWLASGNIPAPTVVDSGVLGGCEYLVSTAAPGRPASDPWPVHQRMAVMDAVADFARELHAVPVDDCPFDRGLTTMLNEAREAVARDLVDPREFDDEWCGMSADEALTELLDEAEKIERGPEVLCHGDFCLPNILLDPETLRGTAMVYVGRLGKADRYVDLALMTRSVSSKRMNHQFGDEHADRFVQHYGENPVDEQRVYFYRLLDEIK